MKRFVFFFFFILLCSCAHIPDYSTWSTEQLETELNKETEQVSLRQQAIYAERDYLQSRQTLSGTAGAAGVGSFCVFGHFLAGRAACRRIEAIDAELLRRKEK